MAVRQPLAGFGPETVLQGMESADPVSAQVTKAAGRLAPDGQKPGVVEDRQPKRTRNPMRRFPRKGLIVDFGHPTLAYGPAHGGKVSHGKRAGGWRHPKDRVSQGDALFRPRRPGDLGQGSPRRSAKRRVASTGNQVRAKGKRFKFFRIKGERGQEIARLQHITDPALATDWGAHRLQIGNIPIGGAQRYATVLCDLPGRDRATPQTQRVQKGKQTKEAHRRTTASF